jgi:hypothetical protein
MTPYIPIAASESAGTRKTTDVKARVASVFHTESSSGSTW